MPPSFCLCKQLLVDIVHNSLLYCAVVFKKKLELQMVWLIGGSNALGRFSSCMLFCLERILCCWTVA